jgi:adenine/guanine/hypoxanthine permease
MSTPTNAPKWFVRGDIDGFFGLFIDNLLQILLIAALCKGVLNFDDALVFGKIVPGAAVSILVGNLFYSWQAMRLAKRTGRTDVTALPYGINTVSIIAFVFFVMAPVYGIAKEKGHANPSQLAWEAGLFACLTGAVIEIIGAFTADWLRRYTPRAALLSALAGIAITFISMGFIFQMFAMPIVTVVPLFIMLVCYAGNVKFRFLPGGLLSVIVGGILAWGSYYLVLQFPSLGWAVWTPPAFNEISIAFHPPIPVFSELFRTLADSTAWPYMTIILPMSLFNVLGSLQNLESADAAGDHYETKPSLLVNGIGSVVAALFGSPFPTTIYIGHPGWKAMGARIGYSVLNGFVITVVSLLGVVSVVTHIVPIEAMLPILLWIGIIITAQSFADVPKRHYLAVAIGLIPSLAAWARSPIIDAALTPGTYLEAVKSMPMKGVSLSGAIALEQGFIITSILFSAALAYIIDRQFHKAAGWLGAAAVFSFVGLIHAYTLKPFSPEPKLGLFVAPEFAIGYGISAIYMLVLHLTGHSDKGVSGDAGLDEQKRPV